MIAEALIVSAAAVLWKSFSFAKWIIEREEPQAEASRPAAFAEKRRILERQREWWKSACKGDGSDNSKFATNKVLDIDSDLLKLADEEANDSRINDIA